MQIRELRADEVEFTLSVEEDDIPVRGNALASGDNNTDKEAEDAILKRLGRGDVWAWANVTVTAEWKGFKGRANCGACSYDDEADFKKCGTYEDLKAEALDDLNKGIASTAGEVAELVQTT